MSVLKENWKLITIMQIRNHAWFCNGIMSLECIAVINVANFHYVKQLQTVVINVTMFWLFHCTQVSCHYCLILPSNKSYALRNIVVLIWELHYTVECLLSEHQLSKQVKHLNHCCQKKENSISFSVLVVVLKYYFCPWMHLFPVIYLKIYAV